MEIDTVIKEADKAARQYGLEVVEIDRTDSIVRLKLVIGNELLILVYGNAVKDKLNLTLVFRRRRLYGYDPEGGR